MSTLLLVLVSVGTATPAHFTAAGHVTARAVPSQTKAKVKPKAEPVVGIFEIVNVVIAAFKATWNTLPSEQFSVSVPLDIVGAVFVSTKLVIVAVVSVGEVAKTFAPLPVSSVRHEARFAELGVARKVPTFVPRPETPVEIGKPVHEVSVPDVGVPSIGVTSVGLVASAFAPEPVEVVTPVPPEATASVADKDAADPVVFWLSVGKVQFVSVPLVGVPRIGVTSVGLVLSTLLPEPVEVVTPVPPDATASVADKDAADPVVFWLSVGKVQFVSVPDVGVPRIGVTSVGLVLSTLLPDPVEVVTPVPPDATASVADSDAADPVVFWLSVGKVQFVSVPLVGVPSAPDGAT